MRTQKIVWLLSICAAVVLMGASLSHAEDAGENAGTPAKFDRARYQKTVERGVRYLLDKGAPRDGSYSAQTSPAVTAICVAALLRSGHSPDEPAIAKSLKYLESFVQSDGGVYKPGSAIQNY